MNSQNMPHPGRVFTLLYLFAIFVAFLSFSVSHAESIAKVRAQKLMRGINVGTVGTGISPECCGNADEVKALQHQKFDHAHAHGTVRCPIEPPNVWTSLPGLTSSN